MMTDLIQNILRSIQKIAVVGYSADPEKTSHVIAKRLLTEGYDVFAVNPKGGNAFGHTVYKTLEDVPEEVDSVVFFRPGDQVAEFLPALLKRKNLKQVWLQLGIKNEDVKKAMGIKGVIFVQDKCMAVELGVRGGLSVIRKKK